MKRSPKSDLGPEYAKEEQAMRKEEAHVKAFWQQQAEEDAIKMFARLKELEIDAGYNGFHEDFVAALKAYTNLKKQLEEGYAQLKLASDRAINENWPVPEAVISKPRIELDVAQTLTQFDDKTQEQLIVYKSQMDKAATAAQLEKQLMKNQLVYKTVSGSVRLK